MPTNRTRRTRRQAPSEEWQLDYLLHGTRESDPPAVRRRPLMFMAEYGGCFANKGAAAMWDEVRDQELPRWIKDRPGSRPYAWWCFDAPEPRPESESEAAYLARHGLLSTVERCALGAS